MQIRYFIIVMTLNLLTQCAVFGIRQLQQKKTKNKVADTSHRIAVNCDCKNETSFTAALFRFSNKGRRNTNERARKISTFQHM